MAGFRSLFHALAWRRWTLGCSWVDMVWSGLVRYGRYMGLRPKLGVCFIALEMVIQDWESVGEVPEAMWSRSSVSMWRL